MADNMINKMMKKPFRNVPAHSGDRLRESKTGFGKKNFWYDKVWYALILSVLGQISLDGIRALKQQ